MCGLYNVESPYTINIIDENIENYTSTTDNIVIVLESQN